MVIPVVLACAALNGGTGPTEAWDRIRESLASGGPVQVRTEWTLELELDGEQYQVDPIVAGIDRTGPRTGRFEVGEFTAFIGPDDLVVTREGVEDSYVRRPLVSTPREVLGTVLDEVPFPMLTLLFPGGRVLEPVEAFPLLAGGTLTPVAVDPTPEGRLTSVRFEGDTALLTLELDPETGRPRSGMLRQPWGEPFPPEAMLIQRWSWSFGPSAFPEPFARGQRFRVDRLQSLRPLGEATMAVGGPALPLALPVFGGGSVDLAALRGRVVVVDFWATWCGPCRRALPQLQTLAEEMAREPVTIVTVNTKEPPQPGRDAKITAVIKDASLTVPVALDEDGAVAKAWGVSGIPATFIVGKDGRIWSSHVGAGPDYLERLREEVLAALAAP